MTEWLLGLVPVHGGWLLAVATFLSCLALPIPASILMLAAGGFAAAGDLTLAGSAGAALAGAVAGDQAGNLTAATGMAVDVLGFLAAGAVALGALWWLGTVVRAERG